jgi:hypothetical protein
MFCSFLALLLRYELERRLEQRGIKLEWVDVIHDLDRLQQIEVLIAHKKYLLRSETRATIAKVFQAGGVAVPRNCKTAERKPPRRHSRCRVTTPAHLA